MAYLGKTPSQAVRQQYFYTATGGETSLSGADDNGNTLTYTDGAYVDVFLNGILLVSGTDYNTTTANTIDRRNGQHSSTPSPPHLAESVCGLCCCWVRQW